MLKPSLRPVKQNVQEQTIQNAVKNAAKATMSGPPRIVPATISADDFILIRIMLFAQNFPDQD